MSCVDFTAPCCGHDDLFELGFVRGAGRRRDRAGAAATSAVRTEQVAVERGQGAFASLRRVRAEVPRVAMARQCSSSVRM
jgi:hypothetical protein